MPTMLMNRKFKYTGRVNMSFDLSSCVHVTPHLGIGDLLILKMCEITNNLNIKQINISAPLIRKYSSEYIKKLKFIQHLIPWIFPEADIKVTEYAVNFNEFRKKYNFQHIPLYKYIAIPNSTTIDYSDSLIFHTKFRHDGLIAECIQHTVPGLIQLFEKYKTRSKIIIMGERVIGTNVETQITKTFSLYNHMLALKGNNDVTDMTQHILTEGTAFDQFLSDIEIIHKCKCNIVFGIGGPCNIVAAFSKASIHVVPFLNNSPYKNDISTLYTNICETVEELEQQLQRYI